MAEHYTNATESDTRYCSTCGRRTTHSVSGNRLGRCTEHDVESAQRIGAARRLLNHLQLGSRVQWKGKTPIGGTVVALTPNMVSVRWDDGIEGDFILPAGDSEAWALLQSGALVHTEVSPGNR